MSTKNKNNNLKKSQIMKTLGYRILIQRKKQSKSFLKLNIDLAANNFSNIERGLTDARFTTLIAISKSLNITLSELLLNFEEEIENEIKKIEETST